MKWLDALPALLGYGAAAFVVAELLAHYEETAFQTPSREQALERLAPPEPLQEPEGGAGDPLGDLFTTLVDRGELVLVGDELVFHRARYEEAQRRVREWITARGSLSAAQLREELGSSRRYMVPLLEHFDEIRLTRREGDVRVLR